MKVQIVLTMAAIAAYELTLGHLWVSGDGMEVPSCPPNEIFKNCLSNCSNCEERGFCAINCQQGGCDCWPRFFRLIPGGPCEPVAKCPKMDCPENEVFRECGPLCERCGIFNCRVILCNHKCYCKQGYRRDSTGQCVPEEECPQRRRCLRDEVMADSGPVDEFCLRGPGEPPNTATQDVRKCYCKPGYKRNFMGRCIEESRCQEVACLGVEEYSSCVPTCNTTCRNYGDPTCKEDGNCFAGCFCRPGYALNDYHACVPVEDCVEGGKRIFIADVIRKEESEKTSSTTDETPAKEERVEEASTAAEENRGAEKTEGDASEQPDERQESAGDSGGQPEESPEAAKEQKEVVSPETEENEEERAENPDDDEVEEAKQEEESVDEAENREPEEEDVENPQEADTTPSPSDEQQTTEATKAKASRRSSKSRRTGDEEKLRSGRKKQISDNEK